MKTLKAATVADKVMEESMWKRVRHKIHAAAWDLLLHREGFSCKNHKIPSPQQEFIFQREKPEEVGLKH